MGKRTWTAERDERLRQLAATGKSATEAGKVMGLSRNAILGRALRVDIHFKGSRWGTYVRKPKSKPAGKPKLVIVTPEFAPPSLGLTIEALNNSVCRWPYGNGPVYSFCGAPTQPKSVLCPHHHSISHVPMKARA